MLAHALKPAEPYIDPADATDHHGDAQGQAEEPVGPAGTATCRAELQQGLYNLEIRFPICKNAPRQATPTLVQLARGYPIRAITGPRQSGKTTLARSTFPDRPYVSSLEDPDTRSFADEDPRGFLARYPDGEILEEAQRCPALFSYLQTRVDADPRMGQFELTGSQQFGLLSGITQPLAGRVGLVQLRPFALQELLERRGGLEPLLLAQQHRRGGRCADRARRSTDAGGDQVRPDLPLGFPVRPAQVDEPCRRQGPASSPCLWQR